MAEIKVRGQMIDVDILAELNNFSWNGLRTPIREKFIACSPFREERRPSFFVNLTGQYAGTWRDSGYVDDEYEKGGFIKLLSFLRNETKEETEDYLIETYGQQVNWDNLTLKVPELTLKKKRNYLPFDTLKQYSYRHPYLERRGIPERIQRGFRIGYDPKRKAVVIPWFDAMGRLANIKYRSVRSKVFWYEPGAMPIRELVFGMNIIYKKGIEEAVICEAEIDAMTWWTLGVPAIAVGWNTLKDKQVSVILKSPIKKIAVCADNDDAGKRLLENVITKLNGFIELYSTTIQNQYKDINEAYQKGATIEYKPEPLKCSPFSLHFLQ